MPRRRRRADFSVAHRSLSFSETYLAAVYATNALRAKTLKTLFSSMQGMLKRGRLSGTVWFVRAPIANRVKIILGRPNGPAFVELTNSRVSELLRKIQTKPGNVWSKNLASIIDSELIPDGLTPAISIVVRRDQILGVAGLALQGGSPKEAKISASALIELFSSAVANLGNQEGLEAEIRGLRILVGRGHQPIVITDGFGNIIAATRSGASALHQFFESEFRNISKVEGLRLPKQIVGAIQNHSPSYRLGETGTALIRPVPVSSWSVLPSAFFSIEFLIEQSPSPLLNVARLSPAEIEILMLILKGGTTQEIARARGVSVPTVKNQVHSILDKTGARDRRELILKGIALLPDPLTVPPHASSLTAAWRLFDKPKVSGSPP